MTKLKQAFQIEPCKTHCGMYQVIATSPEGKQHKTNYRRTLEHARQEMNNHLMEIYGMEQPPIPEEAFADIDAG